MLAGFLLACSPSPLFAADQADVRFFLNRKIIGPRLPTTEIQAYCDSRVPSAPTVTSAAEWTQYAERLRQDVLENIIFRGQAKAWRDAQTKVTWLDYMDGGPGYRIRKLRYEAVPGLWIPALLYEPTQLSGKVPVVLNVNGHEADGKAVPYIQIRAVNLAKRGILALNLEWVGKGQLQTKGLDHYCLNQLDLCGTSGLAVHYLAMRRGLDILLSLEHADPARVAVTGLSGGCWQRNSACWRSIHSYWGNPPSKPAIFSLPCCWHAWAIDRWGFRPVKWPRSPAGRKIDTPEDR